MDQEQRAPFHDAVEPQDSFARVVALCVTSTGGYLRDRSLLGIYGAFLFFPDRLELLDCKNVSDRTLNRQWILY